MKLRFSNKRYFGSMKEFSLLREIGIGTFGSVQVALHIETSKCYAVKIVLLSPFRSSCLTNLLSKSCWCSREKSTCTLPSTTRT